MSDPKPTTPIYVRVAPDIARRARDRAMANGEPLSRLVERCLLAELKKEPDVKAKTEAK